MWMRTVRRLWPLLLAASLSGAQEPPPTTAANGAPRPGFAVFPGHGLYPAYLADWRAPEFSLSYFEVGASDVPQASLKRLGVSMGARFAILRWAPAKTPERPWQIEGEVGFLEQADPQHELDDLGWDGTYAALLAREVRVGLFAQIGTKHSSSHVGDEYIERTGRRRIGYTRDEFTLGVTRRFANGLAAFLELGVNYDLRDRALQERWRVQTGLQKEWVPIRWERFGCFVAGQVEMLQELDWQADLDLRAGVSVRAGSMQWRLGLHHRNGRVPLGEFTRLRESFLALGVWLTP
jgi:uncharacterized protein DUF1207